MRINKLSEREIDERLNLDKRLNPRSFCSNFESKELSQKYYDLQDKIRDGLEKEFWANFDDGIDRSHLKSWEPEVMHTLFCFNSDMTGSDRILVDISHKILSDKLIGVILSYLEKCSELYCVIVTVCKDEMTGKNYIGRFIINLEEIAVEESLVDIWSKQIRFVELES